MCPDRFAFPIACTALLAACNGGDTCIVRSKVNGQWQIDARAHVENGVATFECRHSASGACHFTLFDAECETANIDAGRCRARTLAQFSLRVGGRSNARELSAFKFCATDKPDRLRPDCSPRVPA